MGLFGKKAAPATEAKEDRYITTEEAEATFAAQSSESDSGKAEEDKSEAEQRQEAEEAGQGDAPSETGTGEIETGDTTPGTGSEPGAGPAAVDQRSGTGAIRSTASREEQLAAREAELAAREAAIIRAETKARIDALVASGRVLPFQAEAFERTAVALSIHGEGEALDAFMATIGGTPRMIAYGKEVAAGEVEATPVSLADPEALRVELNRVMAEKKMDAPSAMAYLMKHGVQNGANGKAENGRADDSQ
jgi:hypothetical protein